MAMMFDKWEISSSYMPSRYRSFNAIISPLFLAVIVILPTLVGSRFSRNDFLQVIDILNMVMNL